MSNTEKKLLDAGYEPVYEKVKVENEKKVLGYYLYHPAESMSFESELFLNPILRAVFQAVQQIASDGMAMDNDTIRSIAREIRNGDRIDPAALEHIQEKYKDSNFENIEFARQTMRSDFAKEKVRSTILKHLLPKTHTVDILDIEETRQMLSDLQIALENSTGDHQLLTTFQMMEAHKDVLEARARGVARRSIGSFAIDQKLGNPAAAGEISIFAAQKGHGKSITAKTLESNLVDRGVCVISFNPEMSLESTADRLIALRGENISLRSLKEFDDQSRKAQQIKHIMDDLASRDNYLNCPSETLNLSVLDVNIHKAKMHFKRLGILPPDEYTIVYIDSLDMVEGFDDAEGIKKHVDILHRIARKHKCHIFALVQMNENQIRNRTFKSAEDIDKVRFTVADIYGGSYYAARARVVLCGNRPLLLKKQFFPEKADLWEMEKDIMQINVAKQNDGPVSGLIKFVFNGEDMKVVPYNPEENYI